MEGDTLNTFLAEYRTYPVTGTLLYMEFHPTAVYFTRTVVHDGAIPSIVSIIDFFSF